MRLNRGPTLIDHRYIIDNYESLPDIAIFSHADTYQWHNDDPLYDGKRVLSRLQLSYVLQQGYVSLRCVWTLGCPVEIRPFEEAQAPAPASDPHSDKARAGSFFKSAFEELFPDTPVPEAVGVTCCAQFAVTAETIKQRSRSDYERYRAWLLKTDLNDHLSGIVMEYLWHIIFGRDAVHCPDAQQCYCKMYGLCALNCVEPGVCDAYYTLPSTTRFPEGWPEVGLNGEPQNLTEIQAKYDVDYPADFST